MTREYRNFTREEKIKAVKMVLNDKKSKMEVERTILGKKKCIGTINRWFKESFRKTKKIILKRKDSKNSYKLNHESFKPLIQKYYGI